MGIVRLNVMLSSCGMKRMKPYHERQPLILQVRKFEASFAWFGRRARCGQNVGSPNSIMLSCVNLVARLGMINSRSSSREQALLSRRY